MNRLDFETITTELLEKTKEIRTHKGNEYSNNADVFKSFNDLSTASCTRYDVLRIFLAKHISAINTACASLNGSVDAQTLEGLSEPIEGRISDAINYLLLLHGMLQEIKPKKQDYPL